MIMRPSAFLFAVLCITSFPQNVWSDGDDIGKCSESNQYTCPHLSKLCNESVVVSDCLNCDGFLSTDPKEKLCFDRKLLNAKANPNPSYLWRDIVGMIVWFLAAGVATACGVGGGGIYVPLGILLLNFAPKPSSGLSQASIFGASLGGLALNVYNRHPFTTKISSVDDHAESVPSNDQANTADETYYTRPLIDFDMALFLAPMEMAGAVLGVLIQKILPNWLYLSLASIILGFTAYKTYNKFADSYKTETEARGAAQEALSESEQQAARENLLEAWAQTTARFTSEMVCDDQNQSSPELELKQAPTRHYEGYDEGHDEASTHLTLDSVVTNSDKVERRRYWLERDSRPFPREKLLGLLVLWIGLILLTFLKGGKGVDSIIGITCASPWYSFLIAIQFLWTMGIATIFGYRLTKQTEDKKACDYPWHPHDVLWDLEKVRFYAFFTFLAGIVAGLIGVGGGMVLGPLMLVMGIHPRVSSATTATMIVLTSSSVAVLFVTAGLVPWEYAIAFFCVCFVGACVGKTKIDAYVKKSGRASILIFLLAVIIALATLGCVVIVWLRLAAADWCFAGFNKLCTVSDDDSEGDLCPVDRLLFGRPYK